MTVRLRFHQRHIESIKEKDKRLTARIGWGSSLKYGEEIEFVNAKTNEVFGKGRVTSHYKMSLMNFINHDWAFHRTYNNFMDFENAFGEYYPGEDLSKVEYLKIIEWGKTFERV